YQFFSSATCAVFISDEFPIIFLLINNTLFGYNATNDTWGVYTLKPVLSTLNYVALGVFASKNSSATVNEYSQALMTYAFSNTAGVYNFYFFKEGVPNVNSLSNHPTVT